MAGAGYKLFNTGDVLTAAQVNTYLQEQTVMVFASSAARTTALTGVLAEGMISYLTDTDLVQYYNGTAWTTINTDQTPLTTKGDLFTFSTQDARLAVGNNGETLVADSSTTTGLRWQATQSTQNYIVNGGQDIWQRGTSFASGASAIYTADRWQLLRASGATGATVSRQTGTTGFEYAARVQRDSGNTGTGIVYYGTSLESSQSIPLAGLPVVVSFYARAGANFSSASNALSLSLATGTGTNQNIFSGLTGQVTVGTSVTLTTSFQRFSYTTTLASNETQIATYFSYTPVGTASTNDWFEVTGIQLEVGSVPTTFRRSGGTLAGELAACQRYYREIQFATGVSVSTTSIQTWINHTGMRVAPSVAASAALKVTNASTTDYTQSTAGVSIVGSVPDGGRYGSGNYTGMTTNQAANLIDGGGKIQLSSEL